MRGESLAGLVPRPVGPAAGSEFTVTREPQLVFTARRRDLADPRRGESPVGDALVAAAAGIVRCRPAVAPRNAAGRHLPFGLALWVLHGSLGARRYEDLVAALAELPVERLMLSLGITATGYLVLTGYDLLALRFIRRPTRCGMQPRLR
jgi:hypothetical protein